MRAGTITVSPRIDGHAARREGNGAHDGTDRRQRHNARRLLCAVVSALAVLGSSDGALAQVTADFNGDGVDDLAVGAPGADGSRGTVSVFFGWRGTFSTKPGMTIKGLYTGESYGAALATGDFNGDGRPELVVGAPLWNGRQGRAEVIRFVRNSRGALVPSALSFTETTARGISEANDRFGSALATGDFDGDGFTDLAIGIPGESTGTVASHGAVRVLYGTRYGITSARAQYLSQGLLSNWAVADWRESNDRFGTTLASGDFNGDRLDDLAVGVPYEEEGYNQSPSWNSGVVHMFYGSARQARLSVNSQHLVTPPPALWGGAMWFGYALAVGDFDGDRIEDLAIGAPARRDGLARDSLLVVRYGLVAAIPAAESPRTVVQRSEAIPRQTSLFGAALTAGDFNNDGYDDLAVGAPRHDVGGTVSAGVVIVLYGAWSGFQNAQMLHQDSRDMREISESGDRFGWSLAALDFDGDGWEDLAVGIPGEDVSFNRVVDGGAVAIVAGSGTALTGMRNALLGPAVRQAYAHFGEGLSR